MRLIIDGGSEELYIETRVAGVVQCEKIGTQLIRHQMFGGRLTDPEDHALVKFKLWTFVGSRCGEYVFNAVSKIANSIPKPCKEVVEDLRLRGIPIQNQTGYTEDLQILAGSDISAQIWT